MYIGWFHKDKQQLGATKPRNKGGRLCFLHAMTGDGLITGKKELKEIGTDVVWDQQYLTAEWVFRANANIRDYHKNMDSHMFMRWVRKQLIPTFKKQFPGKKMVLILDNAPYHHSHPEDGINVKKLKKSEVVKLLKQGQFKCKSIKVAREAGDLTFKPADYSKAAPAGPYVSELREQLLAVVEYEDPDRLKTELQLEFEKNGYELIFTPPYM